VVGGVHPLAGAGIILGTYVMTHHLGREVGCAI
jgi:hypothetical protein